uniref:Cell division protein FtsX n=1 Tax=candidate division WOR-3 bacterium TaxID=2052148 RepID=A0A7C4CCN9_UNCW3
MKASYLLRETGRTIARSRGSFVLAGAVQTVCLFLLSIFVLLTFNLSALVAAAGRRAELYAFLSEEAATAPGPLLERVAALDGITAVRLVPPDSALSEFRADLGSDTLLLGALEANPLPPSLRVAVAPDAATAEAVADIERKLALMPGVTEVWSGREIIAQLNRALRALIAADALILTIVSLSVIFIVFQTVQTSIAARSQEIEIMSLVGATRSAIRLPFLLQGALQGLAGGIFAFAATLLLHRIVVSAVPAPLFPAPALAALDAGLGLLLGLVGSLLALNRLTEARTPATRPAR